MAQIKHSTQKDWVSQVLEDMEKCSIQLEKEDIKKIKKTWFKKIVKEAARKEVFLFLIG